MANTADAQLELCYEPELPAAAKLERLAGASGVAKVRPATAPTTAPRHRAHHRALPLRPATAPTIASTPANKHNTRGCCQHHRLRSRRLAPPPHAAAAAASRR